VSASESQATTIQRTCLDEIDRCRQSPDARPWFLGLRSERYGWVQEKFNPPSDFEQPEHFAWMEDVMRQHPAGLSITSMEVWHALLGCTAPGQQPHAFFSFRDPSFAKAVPADWQWVFDFEYLPTSAPVDLAVSQQYSSSTHFSQYRKDLDTITEQIRRSQADGKSICFDYSPVGPVHTRQTGQLPNGKRFGTGSVTNLQAFCQEVFSLLYTALDNEYPAYGSVADPLALAAVQHELLSKTHAKNFVGRSTELSAVTAYLNDSAACTPLVVHADTGLGKTAFLAKCATEAQQAGAWVLKHFVGTNAESFSGDNMLLGLIRGLANLLDLKQATWVSEAARLRAQFSQLLAAASQQHKDKVAAVVFVVDGVEKLTTSSSLPFADLSWVPLRLPPGIKMILSCSTDSSSSPVLQAASSRRPPMPLLSLQPIDREDAATLVRKYLDVYHKKLCEDPADGLLGDQMSLLLSKVEACTPLYLRTILNELVRFGVYEKLTVYLTQLPELLRDLFAFVLKEIEQEHGEEFARVAFTTLAVVEDSILESDYARFLADYPFTQPVTSDVSRLLAHIRPYVAPGAPGLLRIASRPLAEAVHASYLQDKGTSISSLGKSIQMRLCAKYLGDADPRGDWSFINGSTQALMQLSRYILRTQGSEALEALLLRPAYLMAKSNALGVDALLADFDQLSHMSARVSAVFRACLMARPAIHQEPAVLPAQIAARLFQSSTSLGLEAFQGECLRLSTLIVAHRDGSLNQVADHSFDSDVASLVIGKPAELIAVSTRGQNGAMAQPVCMVMHPKEEKLVLVTYTSLLLFSLPRLERLLEIDLISKTANGEFIGCACFSADGSVLICGAGGILNRAPPLLYVLDPLTGMTLLSLDRHRSSISAVVSNGLHIISADSNGLVCTWHQSTGDLLLTVQHSSGVKTMMLVHPSMNAEDSHPLMAMVSFDSSLSVWSLTPDGVIKQESQHVGVFNHGGASLTPYDNVFLDSAAPAPGSNQVYIASGSSVFKIPIIVWRVDFGRKALIKTFSVVVRASLMRLGGVNGTNFLAATNDGNLVLITAPTRTGNLHVESTKQRDDDLVTGSDIHTETSTPDEADTTVCGTAQVIRAHGTTIVDVKTFGPGRVLGLTTAYDATIKLFLLKEGGTTTPSSDLAHDGAVVPRKAQSASLLQQGANSASPFDREVYRNDELVTAMIARKDSFVTFSSHWLRVWSLNGVPLSAWNLEHAFDHMHINSFNYVFAVGDDKLFGTVALNHKTSLNELHIVAIDAPQTPLASLPLSEMPLTIGSTKSHIAAFTKSTVEVFARKPFSFVRSVPLTVPASFTLTTAQFVMTSSVLARLSVWDTTFETIRVLDKNELEDCRALARVPYEPRAVIVSVNKLHLLSWNALASAANVTITIESSSEPSFGHEAISSVCVSPDGKRVVGCAERDHLSVWSLPDLSPLLLFSVDVALSSAWLTFPTWTTTEHDSGETRPTDGSTTSDRDANTFVLSLHDPRGTLATFELLATPSPTPKAAWAQREAELHSRRFLVEEETIVSEGPSIARRSQEACSKGNLEALQALIAGGADIDEPEKVRPV
jgi:WD40 repeat protein